MTTSVLKPKEKLKYNSKSNFSFNYISNYFKLYKNFSCTGTAVTESEEFLKYIITMLIPTNKEMIRKDFNDQIFRTEKRKWGNNNKIKDINKKGQPLIFTSSIKSEIYSNL